MSWNFSGPLGYRIWQNIRGGKLLQMFSLTAKVFPCIFCIQIIIQHLRLMTVCKCHLKLSLKLTPTEHQHCEWSIKLPEKFILPFSFTFLTGSFKIVFQGKKVSLARSGRTFKHLLVPNVSEGQKKRFRWQSIK